MEGVFHTASMTAEMGKKLLKEMDRALSAVATSNRRMQQDAPTMRLNERYAQNDAPDASPENCEFIIPF